MSPKDKRAKMRTNSAAAAARLIRRTTNTRKARPHFPVQPGNAFLVKREKIPDSLSYDDELPVKKPATPKRR